jgi:hypothetical protein
MEQQVWSLSVPDDQPCDLVSQYYQKKLTEGKSKVWALRCLRRFVIRRIYSTLKETVDKKAN